MYDDTTGCLKQISQKDYTNNVTGQNSVVLGQGNTVDGEASSVIGGQGNDITGDVSVAMGYGNIITASYAGAFGNSNSVSANNAFCLGRFNTVSGAGAICGGNASKATPNAANGVGSVALGVYVKSTGQGSFACGWGQPATNDFNTASGDGSFVAGVMTKAQNAAEAAGGLCNLSHSVNPAIASFGNAGNTLFSIGNGQPNAKKNSLEVMQNGDVYVNGIGGYAGTNTKVQDATIKTLQDVVANKTNKIDATITITSNLVDTDFSSLNGFTTAGVYNIECVNSTLGHIGAVMMVQNANNTLIVQFIQFGVFASGVGCPYICRGSSDSGATWSLIDNKTYYIGIIDDSQSASSSSSLVPSRNYLSEQLRLKQNKTSSLSIVVEPDFTAVSSVTSNDIELLSSSLSQAIPIIINVSDVSARDYIKDGNVSGTLYNYKPSHPQLTSWVLKQLIHFNYLYCDTTAQLTTIDVLVQRDINVSYDLDETEILTPGAWSISTTTLATH